MKITFESLKRFVTERNEISGNILSLRYVTFLKFTIGTRFVTFLKELERAMERGTWNAFLSTTDKAHKELWPDMEEMIFLLQFAKFSAKR